MRGRPKTEFETIREQIVAGDAVPSISEFFGAAFLYENEIRELFGINVDRHRRGPGRPAVQDRHQGPVLARRDQGPPCGRRRRQR
jgi:hypothetical protein